jgi:hypothetical protein
MLTSVRPTNRSKTYLIRPSIVIAVMAAVLSVTSLAMAEGVERPRFRQGLWHFDRTIEYIRQLPNANLLLVKQEMTRCVDPTLAMVETFASPDVGNCHSAKPQTVDNRYIFSNRCDFMGPVRTEITVKSDVAYTEINMLTVGNFPRKEVVVAHRVGDCGNAEVQNSARGSRDRKPH